MGLINTATKMKQKNIILLQELLKSLKMLLYLSIVKFALFLQNLLFYPNYLHISLLKASLALVDSQIHFVVSRFP